jgi:MFS family permease
MGLLWLSTVPPTNAIVAQIFGVQYMSMLGGFVFLSHQVGSFMGVWLGGKLFDSTGSYDLVWWLAVALGVFAALINLPVRETAIVRPRRSPHETRLGSSGPMGRRAGGAGGGVHGVSESALDAGPGEPRVVMFLRPRRRHAFDLGAAVCRPRTARRHRAGPGLRQRPPCALAGRPGICRHRRGP